MKIIILISIITIAVLLIGKNFIDFVKRNLLRNQAAWSGKDLKLKYTNSREGSKPIKNDNYLKIIADESKIYLEGQTNNKGDQSK